MQPKMIQLVDGRTIEAQIIASDRADWGSLQWIFKLCGTEKISGGDYYLIRAIDMEDRSPQKKDVKENPEWNSTCDMLLARALEAEMTLERLQHTAINKYIEPPAAHTPAHTPSAPTIVSEEHKNGDSIVGLWNGKNRLASQLDELIKPFCEKYRLNSDQILINFNNIGTYIKVTL